MAIRLAIYFHNHQPVGNFEEVFEFAYLHSYLPLLKTLSNHPKIKFGIHNSGPLCDWLLKKHPEYFEILKALLKREQAEVLASAYSEPILSLIPRNDAIDQIKYFKDYLYNLFDYESKGFWLTERVWEPGLISILNEAGIEYTLLDDTHFKYAGLGEEELFSYYITEECGKILKVFPISMKLRYLIPFHRIDESIAYLGEEEKKSPLGLKTLGDDGEKFGVWPGTYEWVYNQHWLEDFLTRIENEEWIETVHLKDIIKEVPAGRVYLPTASYEEMGEWALPLNAGRDYEELKKGIDHKYYHLIHGGYFKNFLRHYPEANLMHKRMIYVSKNIKKDDTDARISLWRGQCSCAYWHGIFGGLYLPHLREAVYRNLIDAESKSPPNRVEVIDFDTDGMNEIVVSNKDFFSVLKPEFGKLIELDDRKRRMNLLNYIGRRREKYHDKILTTEESEDGVRSIHEILKSKERGLQKFLVYDRYERGFGIDHILVAAPSEEEFYHQKNPGEIIKYNDFEILEIKEGNFLIRFKKENFEKTMQFIPDERIIEFSYRGVFDLLGIEFSLGIFAQNLLLDNTHSLNEMQKIGGLDRFSISGENFSSIIFSASVNFDLLSYPIETVSSSESGFERIFQGFSLMLIFTQPPVIRIKLS
uniref:DUF1926 domain-containing protein n=1 Tax=candidate division WOR-3 bacterium TaxID=2052148 RepID=A0A7C4XBB0_UNCW3